MLAQKWRTSLTWCSLTNILQKKSKSTYLHETLRQLCHLGLGKCFSQAEGMEVTYCMLTPRIPGCISVAFLSSGKPVCPHLAGRMWAVPSFVCMLYSVLQVWLALLCRGRIQSRENLTGIACEVSNKSRTWKTLESLSSVSPVATAWDMGSYKYPVVLNYLYKCILWCPISIQLQCSALIETSNKPIIEHL